MAANAKNRKKALGSIMKEGDSWAVFYYILNDKGVKKRTCKRSFPSEEEAKAFLDLKNAEFGEQEEAFQSKRYVEDRALLLSDYLANHFENVYSRQVENSTATTYRYTLYHHLLPVLKSEEYSALKLVDVTRRELNSIISRVSARKPSYGGKAKEIFSIFMAVAKQDNLILNNPAINLKVPRYERKKFYPIRVEKVTELLTVAAKTPTYLEILLGLMMGLRKGEVYGIKIEDINFTTHILKICQQVTYECEFDEMVLISQEQTEKDLKTDSSERTLYIPDLIMDQIYLRLERIDRDKKRYGVAYEDNGYLCGQRNGKPRAGSCLNGALGKLSRQIGIPEMAFHDLRHMTVTILMFLRFELKTIANILGHSSVETTLKHYAADWDGEDNINTVINRLLCAAFGDGESIDEDIPAYDGFPVGEAHGQ